MAEHATLARPYGNAAFAFAKANDALAAWSQLLALLGAAAGMAKVRALMASPDLSAQRKAEQLAALCGDAIDDAGRRFLGALASNGRLPLLQAVQARFEELKAEQERKLDIEVRSAFPLTLAQMEGLKMVLRTRFDYQINLSSTDDPKLLGGAIIRAGDLVIDGSAQGRLAQLREALARA